MTKKRGADGALGMTKTASTAGRMPRKRAMSCGSTGPEMAGEGGSLARRADSALGMTVAEWPTACSG
jgi:hypothetical protein